MSLKLILQFEIFPDKHHGQIKAEMNLLIIYCQVLNYREGPI
jgi:hypothetical protein